MSREQLRAIILEFYAQAAEGEPVRDVFIKMKRLVKKKGLKPMSEQNQNGTVAVETLETEAPKKRGGNRRGSAGQSRGKASGASGTQSSQVVNLSPAQVCNLWRAAMGGELVIEQDPAGGILCRVSFSSFEKALPALLDHLSGGAK